MEFVRIVQQIVRNVFYKIIKLNAHHVRLDFSLTKTMPLIAILAWLPAELASDQMRSLDNVSIVQCDSAKIVRQKQRILHHAPNAKRGTHTINPLSFVLWIVRINSTMFFKENALNNADRIWCNLEINVRLTCHVQTSKLSKTSARCQVSSKSLRILPASISSSSVRRISTYSPFRIWFYRKRKHWRIPIL